MNIKYSPPCFALFLNSGGGWTPGKENSFILFRDPAFSLFSKNGLVTVNSPEGQINSGRDPVSMLQGYLSEGYFAVGYFGYEFSKFTEGGFIPVRQKEGEHFPDVCFLFFKEKDMISGRIDDLKYLLQTSSEELLSLGEGRGAQAGFGVVTRREVFQGITHHPYSNMTKNEYIRMVRRVKDYIASGDVYQVNLSQRFTTAIEPSPLSYFFNLYAVQPVPFGCYMNFGEFQLVSGSMELFLRKTGKEIVTKPIKGTKKRGFTVESDAVLRAELVSSEKERAENLMIVDLMRNDLGRVCKYGTVKVNKLFDVESYSTLHQMVSEIEGHLKDDVSILDIIKNTFPPGSVTGAPKKRALEIIDELEPHLRGPYCGALGLFSPNGDFTLSVAIRILVSKEGRGAFWVGGGIVWDSDPEKEYEETLIKAKATKKALGMIE